MARQKHFNVGGRYFYIKSGIMMIVVPVIASIIVGASCSALIWATIFHGLGLGIHEPEEFNIC